VTDKHDKKIKLSEADVKKLVTGWLNAHNILWHFVPNQGTWNAKRGAYMTFKGHLGAPDIVAIVGGGYIGIELKSSVGRLSPAQKECGSKIVAAGGKYLVINGSLESMTFMSRVLL